MDLVAKWTISDPGVRERTEELFRLLRLRNLSPEQEEPLHKKIKKLIDDGVDVGATGSGDETALHLATYCGYGQVVQLLLTAGADKEARNTQEWTPIHSAVRKGHLQAAQALLAAGVNKEARDDSGDTVLHVAALVGRVEVVRTLLAYGMDGEIRDAEGKTALHKAVITNTYPEMLLLLLEKGTSVHAKDIYGQTVCNRANRHLDARILRHTKEWSTHLNAFYNRTFTPQTPADWLGLASVMPLSDPQAYSSVKERVEQLMDWHKGLKALRSKAAIPTIGGLGV